MNQFELPEDERKRPLDAQRIPDAGGAATQKRQLNPAVMVMGAASTAITLVLVEVIRGHHSDPMLYFADSVIPIGSIGVGLVAGTGYGLGSWIKQSRLSRTALLVLAALHALAWVLLYVFAWWRWVPAGPAHAGLFEWFDMMTRTIRFEDQHGHAGDPIGALGYLVRLGEVAGFAGGGLIIPLILFAKPYCETCQRYLTQRQLFSLPAAAEHISFVRQKTLDAANAPVRERLAAQVDALNGALASGDGARIRGAIEGMAAHTAPNRKVNAWFSVVRHRCPGCGSGLIDFMSRSGRNAQRLQRLPVAGAVIQAADDAADRLPQLRLIAKASGAQSGRA